MGLAELTNSTDAAEMYFDSVPDAMNTLLLEGILADNAVLVNNVAKDNPLFWCVMLLFIALASLTVMYMLVGVLVDVVKMIAATEREAMTVHFIASSLRERMIDLGRDPDTPITKYEFSQIVSMPEIATIVQGIGVDVVVLIDMAEILYDDPALGPQGMDFQRFVETILNMRGNNDAKVKDIKEL